MKIIKFLIALLAATLAGASFTSCEDDKFSGRVERLVLDEEFAKGYQAFLEQTFSIAGKVTVIPVDITGKAETYSSSDPAVATVDADGNVTVLTEGTTTLTITVDEKSVSFILIVSRVVVESLDLDATFANGYLAFLEQTFSIAGKVIVAPANATYKAESYSSSNPTVATVDETGTVIALAEGETTLSITVDEVSARFLLTVSRTLVESVTIDPQFANGFQTVAGEIFSIADKVTITPLNATIQQKIYDSSDTGVATVDENGNVQTVGEGTTTITVTVDGQSADFLLTVAKVPVESLTLDAEFASGYTIEAAQTFSIAGKVTVTPGNATYKAETYSSSDANVATVDVNGTVNALEEGTSTITITVDGVEATFLLTVTKIPVASLTLDPSLTGGRTALVGDALSIAGKVTIEPSNASYQTADYSSSNTGVATVDANGAVTLLKKGSTTLTITVDGVEVSFPLVVEENHHVIEVGQTVTLFADIAQTSIDLSFTSSSTGLATVSGAGLLEGVVAGDLVITVNSSVQHEITVEVIDPGFTIDANGAVTAYSGPGGDIRVPNAGISINDRVFANNATITSVHLNQVVTIGVTDALNAAESFRNCANLTRVIAPNVTLIRGNSFNTCPQLVEVVGDNFVTIKNGVFQDCPKLETINLEKVTELGQFAFQHTNLKSVYMPSLTQITNRKRQFGECPELVSVDMPLLTYVAVDECFYGCPKLTEVNMPLLADIAKADVDQGSGQSMFNKCTGLVSISLPSLKNLRNNMFLDCTALQRLDLSQATGLNAVDPNSIPQSYSTLTIYVATDAIKNLFPATATYTVTVGVPPAS